MIRTLIQTLFRLLPFPTQTGLRVLGNPGPGAPVFLTCNFDLTVRRVVQALEGVDCYLLVAPSKGINVWCASAGGILNAHSVTSVLKTSRIGDRVTHRRLVLPQLAAPGVDTALVQQISGWHCVFGPVNAEDIPAYLEANCQKSAEMRHVGFPLRDRLEMATMWAAPISLLAGIPVVLLNAGALPGLMSLIWGFSLLLFALYHPIKRWVPGSVGLGKTLVLAAVLAAGLAAYGVTLGEWRAGTIFGWGAAAIAVGALLGFDLEGSTPVDANATVVFWGRRWPASLKTWARFGFVYESFFTLSVAPDLCDGCGHCVEVCPKGVFELRQIAGGRKSNLVNPERCEQCTACVRQCPTGAILADPPVKRFADPTLVASR